jgi:hypothetical protein
LLTFHGVDYTYCQNGGQRVLIKNRGHNFGWVIHLVLSIICDSSNRCHAMIHHQNADAMVLASARLRGIPPWTSAILNNYQGGECLSNAHRLGPWRRHFDDELRLPQNHWKIIGKTKKSGFRVAYSVPLGSIVIATCLFLLLLWLFLAAIILLLNRLDLNTSRQNGYNSN